MHSSTGRVWVDVARLIDWLIDPNRSQMLFDSLIEQVENLNFVRFL